MANLMPFAYQGAELRTILIGEDPWFVAPDACRMLDLRDTTSALKMVDDEDKQTLRRSEGPHFPEGLDARVHTVTVVNESGLYALIFQSNKDQARLVRRWITHDVLPAIRKTGEYTPVPALTDDELIHRALTVSARRVAELTEQVAELAPKAEVADRLLTADGDLSVRDAAQALTRAGVKTGQQRLFSELGRRRWVSRAGDGRWRVLQAAIEAGWMSVLPQSHYHPRTGVLVLDPPQPRITPKGLQRLLTDFGSEQLLAS